MCRCIPFEVKPANYIGRLAPSPTGLLHLGHASTFYFAALRAKESGGRLLLRMDDLDVSRCRPAYVDAALRDLEWLGLQWEKPHYVQSSRLQLYRNALKVLHAQNLIYPCYLSRRDLADALSAPHEEHGSQGVRSKNELNPAQDGEISEPIYPSHLRPPTDAALPPLSDKGWLTNWRYRVPDNRCLMFNDGRLGTQSAVCGTDISDFLVWRKDGYPSYQLACAVDDAALGITEVVRGEDLIISTFRQILILESMGFATPAYWHTPLIKDSEGKRLAKRNDALSIASIRATGQSPEKTIHQLMAKQPI